MKITILLIITAILITPVFSISEQNLILYYPLDEGIGTTAYDISGNNNNGNITQSNWSNGIIGEYSLNLTGNQYEYINLTNQINLSNNDIWSVSFWIKSVSYLPSNTVTIFGDDISGFFFANNGAIYIGEWGIANYGLGTLSPDFGNWQHIVITCDGTYWRAYNNGLFISDSKNTAQIDIIINNIGGDISSYNLGLNGAIDDFKVYNKTLDSYKILTEYSDGSGKQPNYIYWIYLNLLELKEDIHDSFNELTEYLINFKTDITNTVINKSSSLTNEYYCVNKLYNETEYERRNCYQYIKQTKYNHTIKWNIEDYIRNIKLNYYNETLKQKENQEYETYTCFNLTQYTHELENLTNYAIINLLYTSTHFTIDLNRCWINAILKGASGVKLR